MQNFDDRQALRDLRNPDAQIIAAIYDRYFPALYRYVVYRLHDEQLAEDIASDVFVRLLEAVRDGRTPHTNLKAWLLSTASHLLADHLRLTYRRPTEALSDNLLDLTPAPPAEYDDRERTRNFQQAYARLTVEQQHVLALRFGLGYSLEETAVTMNKNVNTVKALQFRALVSLQRQIGEVSYE